MPYFIESDNPECSGWATVKNDGEVMGCHLTKDDAIDQMVALSIAEDVEPGGERMARAEAGELVEGDFVEWDSSGGMARGQIEHVMTEGTLGIPDTDFSIDATEDDPAALIRIFRPYEGAWRPTETLVGHRFSTLTKIDPLPIYENDDDRAEVRQVELDVPAYIRDAAARGLELRAEGFGGDGLTEGTIREARAMADGDITEDKVVRANAWAARHAVDLDAPQNTDPDNDDWPGAGAVAHYLWGIDPLNPEPARNWFERKAAEIQEERMMAATMITRSTEDQVRQLAFDVAPNEDGLTLDGYGAVFNEWTEIEDEYGTYRERIMPGAFRRTLQHRMPVLQFDHGTHPLIGSIPLGRITSIVEDGHGLRVKARLSDNWLVQPVRDAIRDGGITGMSFRFRIVKEKWGRGMDGMEERSISEVALYEVGPVVFPAYEQTSVGVRNRDALRALEDAQTREEVMRILSGDSDVESLSQIDLSSDPDSLHSEGKDSPAERHLSIPTKSQRIAKRRLAGIR